MSEIEIMPLGIGEHPDWRFWPEKGRYPTIEGERWMLCTDGCYFVSLDRPGMLILAERMCSVCGCPLHPARPVSLRRRDRCLAHQKGVATRTAPRDQHDREPDDDDWEEDGDEDEDDEEWDDEEEAEDEDDWEDDDGDDEEG